MTTDFNLLAAYKLGRAVPRHEFDQLQERFYASNRTIAELEQQNATLRAQLAAAVERADLADAMLAAMKHTVVVTIGGKDYEGNPTSEINYLQRLRILLERESQLKAAVEAMEDFLFALDVTDAKQTLGAAKKLELAIAAGKGAEG